MDPNTWKLNPGPVAVIVPRYPDIPSCIRNSIDVVSSLSTATTRRKLWQYTWAIGPHRSIIPSIACTPIGVSAPQGVSSLAARHASGFRNSPFGNVIVASRWRIVPSAPERTCSRSLVISG